MSFNGSGTFLINTAGQPVVSGTVISSTAFNALTADLATGLSTVITKDGQTTVTANIPMSTYKFTGLGVGSAATDSANLSQVQSTVTKLLTSVSGTDTITAVGAPVVAAYAAGQMFYFVATGDNTGAVTLNIDSLGAKAVTRDGSVALAAGDIKSGEVVVVVYDGTRFQVVSQLNSAGDARFANVSIASSLYVGGVSTFVGNAGFSANVSIASALSVGGVAAITGATTIGGNLTLSGGTANGVLYLNGSKVATSGSALTFDGTNLGIGTASPGYRLTVSGGATSLAANQYLRFGAGLFASSDGSVDNYLFTGSTALRWRNSADNTELMQLTNTGNLGIGTSSPAFRLHVSGSSSQFALISTTDTTSTTGVLFGDSASNTVGRIEYVHSDNGMRFYTNGTTQATLDTSGNLGLGVTPSAVSVGDRVVQVRNFLFNDNTNGYGILRYNNFFNGTNDVYINTGAVSAFQMQGNAFKWYQAASGTAGNAISFTQAMTLDASGNLGVGTTSPTRKLSLDGGASTATWTGYQQNGSEKFVVGLDASGNPTLNATTSTPLLFKTNDTERARITSAGAFLIGTTSQINAGLLNLAFDTGTFCGIATKPTNNAGYDAARFFNSSTTQIGSISCTASATAYNTSSDYRLKNTVAPMTGALAKVALLKPVTYKWNADGSDGQGFIAHELAEVVPDCVTGEKDAVDAEGKPRYQGVDTSFLVATLTAAIQEQQVMINELMAKVAALESK